MTARAVRAVVTLIAVLSAARFAAAAATPAPSVAADQRPWIVVSDIHYAPYGSNGRAKDPSPLGSDTNPALFDSFLAELARTERNPPVVFIAGDFLGHGFPIARAATTMAYLATRFDRVFPHAQFVITLGNNDSSCGDYETSVDGSFLRAVARAWEPLVDRRGAAPDFVRTFSHDGSYVARLPRAGYRAVVVNDVYGALRYRNACGTGDPAATSLHDLTRQLARGAGTRTWLVTHIPPGIDAYATAHIAHRLVVVPFMRSGMREGLVDAIGAPANRVSLVIAGHTHHFSFRLSDAAHASRDVPILVAPSISPIFRNAPSFLSLDVAPNGTVRDIAETSYLDGAWRRLGSLREAGVASFTARELVRYRERLERGGAARDAYVRLYAGGTSPEIDDRNWPVYDCAIAEFSVSAFATCSGGGVSVLTRAVRAAALVGSAVVAASVFALAIARRRKTRARSF
jgi:sphingomyelin phosphodiesterase acid-like 3